MSDLVTVLIGDALEKLRELPDESVHCVVTSPPYWGLRDYGIKGQLGLEDTPEEYVERLVGIFREVRRVLRHDGTLWLNLGDSYAGNMSRASNGGRAGFGTPREGIFERVPSGLKAKDLVGIPWRVAFALQADGWYLRSDIIWSKPNPMPESVTDRPTKSHEYLFLLAKNARYFFDQEAIRETLSPETYARSLRGVSDTHKNVDGAPGQTPHTLGRPRKHGDGYPLPSGRNVRSVWTFQTRPYKGAHFATFPTELPERCIKAGTSSKGCCAKCGAPWERITERTNCEYKDMSEYARGLGDVPTARTRTHGAFSGGSSKHIGWQPTCSCGIEDTIPCTVLDIFAGSGTTGEVARFLYRKAILIELNPEYISLIRERVMSNTPNILSFGDDK